MIFLACVDLGEDSKSVRDGGSTFFSPFFFLATPEDRCLDSPVASSAFHGLFSMNLSGVFLHEGPLTLVHGPQKLGFV
jgi:hypothetical protein